MYITAKEVLQFKDNRVKIKPKSATSVFLLKQSHTIAYPVSQLTNVNIVRNPPKNSSNALKFISSPCKYKTRCS